VLPRCGTDATEGSVEHSVVEVMVLMV